MELSGGREGSESHVQKITSKMLRKSFFFLAVYENLFKSLGKQDEEWRE